MKPPFLLLRLMACLTPTLVAAATPPALTWTVPAPMTALVWDETRFAPFAATVGAAVEHRLAEADATNLTAADRSTLLAIRVHLALHGGADERALDAAARIRQRLPDGPGRDYAGLTTRAFVAARRATGQGPATDAFRAAFGRAFGDLLAGLPSTAAMRAVLAQQRDKYVGMTAAALRAEVEVFGASVGDRTTCTLADADRLVRWRHRWADLLPLREVIIAQFERAITVRAEAP